VFGRPSSVRERDRYTYWPDRAPVPESVAVNVRGRPHVVTAFVTIPEQASRVEGVLAVQGSVLGGWSFHIVDGKLVYVHNLAGWRTYRVEAPLLPLAAGDHTLAFAFDPPALTLLVDGDVIGTGDVKRSIWSKFSITGAGLTAGWSPDWSPADTDYRGNFRFTGRLHRVEVDVSGTPVIDRVVEADNIINSQ